MGQSKAFRAECFQDHGDVRGFAAGKSLHSLSAMNFSGNKRRRVMRLSMADLG